MRRLGFVIIVALIFLLTLASGAAAIALTVTPGIRGLHQVRALAPNLVETWKSGFTALICLLAGFDSR